MPFSRKKRRCPRSSHGRTLRYEKFEQRAMLAGDFLPLDVNRDGNVSAVDALEVINVINASGEDVGDSTNTDMSADVNRSGHVTAMDALHVINFLNQDVTVDSSVDDIVAAVGEDVFSGAKAPGVGTAFAAEFTSNDAIAANQINQTEVETLLERASQATTSNDAIIAVVDRSGRILGVRVEDGVSPDLQADKQQFAFAIDGAVAKARTAAFFSSNAAPLTSRTIRFISQSTVTQREVESSPTNADELYQGPGFVAPIGVGGHFPPEIPFAPQVDLFAIEHQSRDSQTHPGLDGDKSTTDDNFELKTRFNAEPRFIPEQAEDFFQTWPESYGEQSGMDPSAIPRGIATLPGGIPLYKTTVDTNGDPITSPVSESINLVGGIGVFFPGENGFATHEQGFEHGVGQTERERTNSDKTLEAEFAALIASAGGGITGQSGFGRNIADINATLPALDNFVALSGRIDLVGITLEIYGPTPSRQYPIPGLDRLLQFGRQLGQSSSENVGVNVDVLPDGSKSLGGQAVPHGWLVAPHDSKLADGLSGDEVQQIIEAGINEADRTRAAIRFDVDAGFRAGAKTRMVLAVADKQGDLLGLYRMKDATVFSIDVSIAKSRNTAYYADPDALQAADRVDFDGDGRFGTVSNSLDQKDGDTLPLGTALSSRSFRFLAEPRFPTGTELSSSLATGCDSQPTTCLEVGPHSMLRLPGINPLTGENLDNDSPLAFSVYASATHSSTKAFDAFNVMRNFRDPGDDGVLVQGATRPDPVDSVRLANQNGVVFFPGSSPLYDSTSGQLAGGFGVSGDGVDQDDVVTFAGQEGFAPDASKRVDAFTLGGVRTPFQKFNRNPFAN